VNTRLELDADVPAKIESIDELVITGGRYDILAEVAVPTPKTWPASSMTRSDQSRGSGTWRVLTYLDLVKQTHDWGTG
jgi:hypothetical protein